MQSIVVVGAGEAGARAALALRENGFSGQVTLVGAEAHPPYERPPLSKAALLDDAEPEPRTILRATDFGEAGVVHLARATATGIDRAGHRLHLADGRALAYDRLLLATGATARPLALPGAAEAGVLTLRGFADALALRAALQPGRRIIVIGGGFIGLELAAAASARDAAVTVVELAPRLLARAVPTPLAALIAARHETAGVRILTGTGVAAIRRDGAERLVMLANGETLAADTVIAGIGALPETALAASAGLAIENGVATDATLMTSDPDIFAAGDCCSFPHPLYGGRRIRLEAWRNAQDQGNTAARNLLGAAEPHAAVPWFWSDQYELTLQIAGLPDEGVETVTRDLGTSRLDFHRAADGRLVAVSALGPNAAIAKEVRLAEMLIARRAAPDAASLAAPTVRLKTLLA